eukprot:14786128-Alexandrium_andersonii.AAC.1
MCIRDSVWSEGSEARPDMMSNPKSALLPPEVGSVLREAPLLVVGGMREVRVLEVSSDHRLRVPPAVP